MKNTFKIVLVMIMLLAVVFTLWACNDDEPGVLTSLDTPTDLGASGSTISWNAVENASSYEVVVDSGEPMATTNTYYNLDISAIGTYLIKVRAVGKNTLDETIYSAYAEYTFIKSKKLATPVVNVSGTTVTWAAVENAQAYSVKVLNSNREEKYSNDNQTELTLSLEGEAYTAVGKYTIQVKAIPEATKTEYANSDAGVNYYIVTQKLATPAISNVSSTSIRWTSISGITSYQLKLYKVVGDVETLKGTYSTTSNSYAFTYMDLSEDGKYYCTVKAIGDGEVYLDSDVSTRDKTYDLYVVPTINEASLLLTDGVLSFTSQNVDMLSSFTVSLKTAKADGSSSMATIDKTIWVSDGTLGYELATGDEYDEQRTYFNQMPAGYVKNTEAYDSEKTYYTFDGATYTQATGSHSTWIEYFVNHDAIYYEEAKGTPTYTKVDTSTETFNTRYNYYKKTGEDSYELITSRYKQYGNYDSLVDDDTIYLKKTGETTYVVLGTKSQIETADQGYSNYYSYQSFTSFTVFDEIEEYYKATYAEFDESNYAASTYYIITSASFETNINDLFYTDNGAGNYTYNRSDIAYYGRVFTITVDAQGTHNTVITGDSLTCDSKYVSFRFPYQIDDSVTYADSQLKGYFDTEAEYTAFVTTHNNYYAIESVGDLQYISKATSANYVLMQDLDAQGYLWTPIPTFSGKLDGNNHMISNMVYASTTKYSGLFEKINGATICDLYIVNASNEANPFGYYGGIAGWAQGSITIKNSYAQVNFTTAKAGAAFIAELALSDNALLLNCQAEITMKNVVYSAGLIGLESVTALNVRNCIANGTIDTEDYYYSLGSFEELGKNKINLDDEDKVYAQDGSNYIYLGEYKDRATDAFKKDVATNTYYSAYYYRLIPDVSDYGQVLAAGLIGSALNATIENSIATVEINVVTPHALVCAGGFIGTGCKVTATSCYAGPKYSRDAAKVMTLLASGAEDTSNESGVGGFIGFVYSSASVDTSSFTDCYSTIKVSARDLFGGFVGIIEGSGTSTFTRCYETGGLSDQTATHKGLFYGYKSTSGTSTFTDCYVYDKDGPVIPDVLVATSLNQIYEAFKDSNKVAKIDGYNDQPCLVGAVYTDTYKEEHKASADLKANAYLALYDTSVEVYNMYTSDKFMSYYIGDNTTKGTVLWVLQLKVDDNDDGIDDGTGQRIVIYVTVT